MERRVKRFLRSLSCSFTHQEPKSRHSPLISVKTLGRTEIIGVTEGNVGHTSNRRKETLLNSLRIGQTWNHRDFENSCDLCWSYCLNLLTANGQYKRKAILQLSIWP
ncbi:hypothetical protein PoB_003896000 [Plakobranchus ocellatus]|uniref:Uncharacterized protein n=1 Tax=Plakobranchus ocellatus TaxID=259542 RepID=A0AAV4AYT5_9GAST|nr:hypothetical protein PoB_003896000 [Plakobranchus ocellatus]